ncbi:Crp/Fnr family transcriptional regulator [Maribacter sp. 2308TA10-17]|uniref:Crp/Fnr family transcriptional regulator n=1 Tax=Maribacter sp. 2308TA10-17 TaxID=3386276 RepID=UPI0039BCDBBA
MVKKNIDQLIQVISSKGEISTIEINLIQSYFKQVSVLKNTILEEQEKIPKHLYFVASGFMRLFYFDNQGEEHTTYLATSNGFIASFSSLINQTKATENVECVTDCKLFKISFSDTKKFIDKSEIFKQFCLVMFEKAISSSTIRANDLAILTAEQRYQKMMEQQPYFIQNVPLQYIASFLGIKPQSLSRIRKQGIK